MVMMATEAAAFVMCIIRDAHIRLEVSDVAADANRDGDAL